MEDTALNFPPKYLHILVKPRVGRRIEGGRLRLISINRAESDEDGDVRAVRRRSDQRHRSCWS